ncbi:MAG TPA: hypothetical protein VJI98_00025 [Candidatus Nanoarchaeia archaeon]|nr:hypothetical protein [Candidatus Nanoarchaeia archaeon]
MSIIIAKGHRETAEVEFIGKHPDTFSSYVAAKLVENLATKSENVEEFRSDINVQSLYDHGKVRVTIGGQIVVNRKIKVDKIATETVISCLKRAGYVDYANPNKVIVKTIVTKQSNYLNNTSKSNNYADSCVVYGHYLHEPFGVNGTFPSLIIAQQIDKILNDNKKQLSALRYDGKVHVTVIYNERGFKVDDVYISVAHKKNCSNFDDKLKQVLINKIPALKHSKINVNQGGEFSVYFLKADSGVSKAKDDIIITGGIHQLGTDRVWGKCLYKASSILIPYVFAMSKAICECTGADYSSVSAFAKYGQREAEIQLCEIDPKFERLREKINRCLENIPRDSQSIRTILNLPISKGTYKLMNDISGFHDSNKPWKKKNRILIKYLKEGLGSLSA